MPSDDKAFARGCITLLGLLEQRAGVVRAFGLGCFLVGRHVFLFLVGHFVITIRCSSS